MILISHDRHMVELTADRLILVDQGTAAEYAGSMETYIDFVLGRNQPKPENKGKERPAKAEPKPDAPSWGEMRDLRKQIAKAETTIAGLQARLDEIDRAMADPAAAPKPLAGLNLGELARRRSALADELETTEAQWLQLSERLDTAQ